jgi:hypothetical protein
MRLITLAIAFTALTGCGLFSRSSSTTEVGPTKERMAEPAKPPAEDVEAPAVDTGGNGDQE